MGELTFTVEPLALMREQAATLIELHWREVAEEKTLLQPDLDWDSYAAAERAGQLMALAARVGGELVGYFVAIIHQHPHYRRVRVAEEDVHFLRAEFRGQGNGRRLVEAAMAEARRRGAQMMTAREKIAHSHAGLWRSLGFRPLDTVYIARL